MAKSAACIAIVVLLSLVFVNASIHCGTILRTKFEGNPSAKCQQQIKSRDLSRCELIIAHPGSLAVHDPEQREQCCQQLRSMDEECRCQALIEIVWKQQRPGEVESEEDMQEMTRRAKSIPTYCRMGPCKWSVTDVCNPQGCRQKALRQDFSMCEKFISQSGQRGRIAMPASNPWMYLQECCRQLGQVDEKCRCGALKDVMIKKQQEGQYEAPEMHQKLQRAQNIPRSCRLEPQSCQWRAKLY